LQHKKSNWGLLNKKILSNFGLDIPDVIIAGISNGKPGLIEVLLFNLRLKINEQLELEDKILPQTSLSFSTSNSNSNKIALNRFNEPSNSNKNISRIDYEEIKQQYLEQEEQIEVLQAKVRRLEHVLQLKDKRIEHLITILNNDHSNK